VKDLQGCAGLRMDTLASTGAIANRLDLAEDAKNKLCNLCVKSQPIPDNYLIN
jgi:hypothetical protein